MLVWAGSRGSACATARSGRRGQEQAGGDTGGRLQLTGSAWQKRSSGSDFSTVAPMATCGSESTTTEAAAAAVATAAAAVDAAAAAGLWLSPKRSHAAKELSGPTGSRKRMA